jgi:hypothetical protein
MGSPHIIFDPENLPKALRDFIKQIKKSSTPFEARYKFADPRKVIQLCNTKAKQDKRLKNVDEIKIPKTMRISRKCIDHLDSLKEKLILKTHTDVVEYLICKEGI